jgi:hypothetical protein
MTAACPNCGNWASDVDNFCKICGFNLRAQRGNADVSKVTTATETNSPSLSLGPSVDDMRKTIELQGRTDRMISPIWVMVPLVSFGFSIATLVLAFIGIEKAFAALVANGGVGPVPTLSIPDLTYVEIVSICLLIVELYLFYILIKRRNLHFEREYRFFYDTSLALKNLAATRGLSSNEVVQRNLRDIDSHLTSIHYSSRDRNAILWLILFFVPVVDIFAYFYILYFLTTDFGEHEPMEDWLISSVARALGSIGINFTYSRASFSKKREDIPQRSFWLYVVLDIITLGVFGFYWIYVLIKDPNNHFKTEAKIEGAILSAITS